MSEENELPKGWAWVNVERCCVADVGFAFKSSEFVEEGIRLLRGENMEPGALRWKDVRYWPEGKLKGYEHLLLAEGDIVLAMDRPLVSAGLKIARVRATDLPCLLVQRMARLRVMPTLNTAFLFNAMQTQRFITHLVGEQQGTQLPHISGTSIKEFVLPFPPLPEQHRIVEKIEELFSDLDAGVASLQRAKANLKRYRASVLKSAVEGRLTGHTSFPHKRFEELIDGLSQGWSPKCELNRDPEESEWAIIKTTAVQSLAYSDREAKPLPDSLDPRPYLEICEGDFLMTRKGPRQRAGVACLVRHTRPRLMVCDTVYRFRCRPEIVNPAFLEIALNSPVVVEAIDRLKSGINDSGVSLTHNKLYAVPIPLPPLAEQEQIVALVEERLSQIDSAEKTIDSELIRSKRLRQSILKRAFEGKLVPQDAKDEPASVLLERIKVSRETEQPKTKAKKATKVKAK